LRPDQFETFDDLVPDHFDSDDDDDDDDEQDDDYDQEDDSFVVADNFVEMEEWHGEFMNEVQQILMTAGTQMRQRVTRSSFRQTRQAHNDAIYHSMVRGDGVAATRHRPPRSPSPIANRFDEDQDDDGIVIVQLPTTTPAPPTTTTTTTCSTTTRAAAAAAAAATTTTTTISTTASPPARIAQRAATLVIDVCDSPPASPRRRTASLPGKRRRVQCSDDESDDNQSGIEQSKRARVSDGPELPVSPILVHTPPTSPCHHVATLAKGAVAASAAILVPETPSPMLNTAERSSEQELRSKHTWYTKADVRSVLQELWEGGQIDRERFKATVKQVTAR
jgi:hypothetical protein